MNFLSTDLPEEQCVDELGSKPFALAQMDAPKELQLFPGYRFPCDGEVRGWDYYRSSTGYDSYVTIWRYYSLNGNNDQFRLISKTKLPDATIGVQSVALDTTISVEKGDFIGIVHGSQVPNSQLPFCEEANDPCPTGIFSQVLTINVYSHSLAIGSSIWQSNVHGRSTVNRMIPIVAFLRTGMYHAGFCNHCNAYNYAH